MRAKEKNLAPAKPKVLCSDSSSIVSYDIAYAEYSLFVRPITFNRILPSKKPIFLRVLHVKHIFLCTRTTFTIYNN